MKFVEIDICKVRSSTDQVKLQWLLLNLFLVGRYRMGMMIWTYFWYSYVSFMIFFLWGDLVLILDSKLISLVPFFTGAIAEGQQSEHDIQFSAHKKVFLSLLK